MVGEAASGNSDPGDKDGPIVQVPADMQAPKRDADRDGLPRPFEREGITDAGSPPDNDYPGRDETTGGGDPSDPVRSLPQEHADGLGEAADRGQEWH
jgi:hypothetical protein